MNVGHTVVNVYHLQRHSEVTSIFPTNLCEKVGSFILCKWISAVRVSEEDEFRFRQRR